MKKSLKGDYADLSYLYKEYLKEVVRLLRKLKLYHPLSIHTVLCYLYDKGYINIDDNFNFYKRTHMVDRKFKKEYLVPGALFLNNHGVCRNASSFELDVLKNSVGFDGQVLCGYMGEPDKNIKLNESLADLITKGDIREKSTSFSKDDDTDEFVEFISYIIGNHAICNVNDEYYSYYLDLYNLGVYSNSNNNVLVFDDGAIFEIRRFGTFMYTLAKRLEQKKTLNEEDVYLLIYDVLEDLKNSPELLLNFRRETLPILEESEDVYQRIIRK